MELEWIQEGEWAPAGRTTKAGVLSTEFHGLVLVVTHMGDHADVEVAHSSDFQYDEELRPIESGFVPDIGDMPVPEVMRRAVGVAAVQCGSLALRLVEFGTHLRGGTVEAPHLARAWNAGYAAAGRDVQQLLSGEVGERERNPYDKDGAGNEIE